MSFAKPSAWLIYDGEAFVTPPGQDEPRHDQMQGSDHDRIVEFGGRTCYDSLGAAKSRGSRDYHAHIREVNHSSVLAHACWPFELRATWLAESSVARKQALAACFLNRPGCWVKEIPGGLRVMINARAIRQWQRWPCVFEWNGAVCAAVGHSIQRELSLLCPLAGEGLPRPIGDDALRLTHSLSVAKVVPSDDGERWASFYTTGSRGYSHEQVRHAFTMTAVSQRSTRFCDEDGSPWVPHPLLREGEELAAFGAARDSANDAYRKIMESCKKRLGDNTEVGRTQATKQARGAARGVQGNALETRLIFSATIMQWKWQLFQRMAEAADAEIRVLYNDVFEGLRTRWPASFVGWETRPASDGCGLVLSAFGDDPQRYGWGVS